MNDIKIGDLLIYNDEATYIGIVIREAPEEEGWSLPAWEVAWNNCKNTTHILPEIKAWRFRAVQWQLKKLDH